MPNLKFEGEAEWLALREMHVGGSEVAALFYQWKTAAGETVVRHMFEPMAEDDVCLGCLSPYSTGYRLFQEKAGKLKPEDFGSERMDAGTYLESAIAEWSRKKFDWNLRKVRRYIQHPNHPGWGASLDFEVHEKGRAGWPVEVKNVDGLIYRDQWVGEGDEIFDWPLHINLQLQHQIGAAEAPEGYVVCCVRGNELKRGHIRRHEATQARIGEAIDMFWQAVDQGADPYWLADLDTVADLWAVGDAENDEPLDFAGDEAFSRDLRQAKRWAAHQKFVDGHLKRIKGRIGAALQDRKKATGATHRVTWPVINREAKTVSYVLDAKTYRGGMTITELKK